MVCIVMIVLYFTCIYRLTFLFEQTLRYLNLLFALIDCHYVADLSGSQCIHHRLTFVSQSELFDLIRIGSYFY